MKSNNNHQQNVQQSVQVRHYTDTLAYVEATKFYQRTRIISIKKMSQVSKQQKRQQPKTRQMYDMLRHSLLHSLILYRALYQIQKI